MQLYITLESRVLEILHINCVPYLYNLISTFDYNTKIVFVNDFLTQNTDINYI